MSDSEEDDYSDSGSGSGSDEESNSGSDDESGSGSEDESGSDDGSGSDDDENDEADDVLGLNKEAEEQVIKDDVQMIVEVNNNPGSYASPTLTSKLRTLTKALKNQQLCSQMDSSLNRIRFAFKARPPIAPLGPTLGPNDNGNTQQQMTESGNPIPKDEGRETPRDVSSSSIHSTPELNKNTPSHQDSENLDPTSKNPSRQSSRSKIGNPNNWDALSSDSIQPDFFTPNDNPNGINLPLNPEGGVIDGGDLYKYNVGGVGLGGGMGEEGKARMIQEAIKALMEADD